MKKGRLAAAAVLALVLAPGTLVRTPVPQSENVDLSITLLTDLPERDGNGGFTREGVWEISSPSLEFGGYSALLVLGQGELLRAFSDRGTMLTFAPPGGPSQRPARFANVWDRGPLSKTVPDIESATRDPETGDYWLGFEYDHAVIRYSVGSAYRASLMPPEWQQWPDNAGAEAMARLPGGGFIVLPEGSSTGLLYPSDPVDGAQPLSFSFFLPDGFRPTDLAALPDGRILVLMRRLAWHLPPFEAAIGLADPRGLKEGDRLDIAVLVELETILPRDNYEALALADVAENGTIGLWLMSDDNRASSQRTLLARLNWRETDGPYAAHEKAREEP